MHTIFPKLPRVQWDPAVSSPWSFDVGSATGAAGDLRQKTVIGAAACVGLMYAANGSNERGCGGWWVAESESPRMCVGSPCPGFGQRRCDGRV